MLTGEGFETLLPPFSQWWTHQGNDPVLYYSNDSLSIYYVPDCVRYSIHGAYPDGKMYVFELTPDN